MRTGGDDPAGFAPFFISAHAIAAGIETESVEPDSQAGGVELAVDQFSQGKVFALVADEAIVSPKPPVLFSANPARVVGL